MRAATAKHTLERWRAHHRCYAVQPALLAHRDVNKATHCQQGTATAVAYCKLNWLNTEREYSWTGKLVSRMSCPRTAVLSFAPTRCGRTSAGIVSPICHATKTRSNRRRRRARTLKMEIHQQQVKPKLKQMKTSQRGLTRANPHL